MSSKPSTRIDPGALFGALLTLVLFSGSTTAQTGPLTFEFSFSNPGARSLGFGGAFAALADDATAAFANPAGLVQLARPEVSIEGRSWSFAMPFTVGGRLFGPPTGIGFDTVPGLRTATSSADLTGLSFLSFVFPKEDWALAFYRHQLANFEGAFETQGFFGTLDSGQPFRLTDVRTTSELDIVSYTVAGAYRVSETFSLGLGFSYFDGKFSSRTDIVAPLDSTLPDGTFGRNRYAPQAILRTSHASSSDTGWGLSAGFLWHLTGNFNLGGSYRQGPTFIGRGGEVSGPALEPELPEGSVIEDNQTPVSFPDVFGLGFSFKSDNGAATASFEWDWVQYSTLVESPEPGVVDENVRLDDGHELHLGLEYVFVQISPVVALRVGTWLDPDHRIRFEGGDLLARAVFRGRDDQWHFAVGFGLAYGRFQLDLGFDFADTVRTGSLSAILSF